MTRTSRPATPAPPRRTARSRSWPLTPPATRAGQVEALLDASPHPQRPVIDAMRAIVARAVPEAVESVKWNSPSFATAEHFATFHLRAKSSGPRMSSSGGLRHMGRERTVLVLCLALAGHACSAPPSLPEPAPATRGDQRRIIYNDISLTRTGCFGTCPIYTVVYRRDGTVTYTGERHVDHVGVREGRIGKAGFADLAQFVERSGFASFDGHYRTGGTDAQTTKVTVTYLDGRTMSVSEYGHSGPPQLWVVQRVIDGMLPDVQWRAPAAPEAAATPPGPTIHGPGYEGVVMAAGTWTPSAADVREFETRLAGYLAASDLQSTLTGTRIRQELANYKRQYWGVVTASQRALLVSFLYDSSTLPAPDEWRTTAVLLEGDDPPYPVSSGIAVSDGGDRYFRLVYDVIAKRFGRLRVNAPI